MMKRFTLWSVFGACLVVAIGAGCGGGEETPKNAKFTQQQEPKKERKPKTAVGNEPTEKLPTMPGRGGK